MLLVYGILRSGFEKHVFFTDIIEGRGVSLMDHGGLVALVSPAPEGYAAPELPDLMTYAKVIEKMNQNFTILPFRYGCILDNKELVFDLLRRCHQVFLTALEEVDGCVEMSIRLLIEESPGRQGEIKVPEVQASGGLAYLAGRKAYYAAKDRVKETVIAGMQEIQSAFKGLFVKSLIESGGAEQSPMQSIYFLVPREKVKPFRQVFQQVQEQGANKVLLTGPWPPYNFFGHNINEVVP